MEVDGEDLRFKIGDSLWLELFYDYITPGSPDHEGDNTLSSITVTVWYSIEQV